MKCRSLLIAACVMMGGMPVLSGCEGFPFKQKPVEYQDVGIIQLKDRLVPAEVRLVKGVPARLHIMDGTGSPATRLRISVLNKDVEVTAGAGSTVTLDAEQVAKLDGATLSGEAGRGAVRFAVVADKRGLRVAPKGGKVELAVVMTDQLAAPKQLTLVQGVPAVVYIMKSDSEAGFDTFQCEALGMKVAVKDREVQEMNWTPERPGTFVFIGTVTPDSQVTMVVIKSGS